MSQSAAMFGSREPSNGCVLIIAEDTRVRSSAHQMLQTSGYDVIEAEDVQKGIEAINTGENPLVVDTVIADIDMEKGIDAVSYFRNNYPHVPLIVVTGVPDIQRDIPQRMRIVLVGAGKGGTALLEIFDHLPEVEIVAITDKDPSARGLARARELGIPVVDDAVQMIGQEGTHLIVDVTGDPNMESLIAERKHPSAEVLGGAAAKLLWNLVQYESQIQRQLLQSEKIASMIRDGITDYLVKPLVREKLLDAVGQAMEQREISKL
jgi:CheY-like chemotaxis protein